jgi:uncharacterized protein (TIGR02145 family)
LEGNAAFGTSGFNALPGGERSLNNPFNGKGSWAGFWAATEINATSAWSRSLFYNWADVDRHYINKSSGISIRCVQGEGSTITSPAVTTYSATSVEETSATLNGNVTGDGGGTVTDRGFWYGLTADPVSTGTKVTVGSGMGSYTTTLTGLSSGDTYYFVAYATNSEGTGYGDEVRFTTGEPDITGQTGTLTDYDGNTYNWIGIGKQAWMAENLKVTHYTDGSAIPLVEDSVAWDALTTTDKAYCWYDNSATNRDIYGGLYTWAAAMNGAASSEINPSGVQGVCPTGWHLPSDAEWKELEMYLGMSPAKADDTGYRGTNEGSKLAGNTVLWEDGPLEQDIAFGTSGFIALPGGRRMGYAGLFDDEGHSARFCTASEFNVTYFWYRILRYSYSDVNRYFGFKYDGYSVRCVRD